MKRIRLAIFLIFMALHLGSASAQMPDPSLTVHLLDYLAKDYAGAVKDGKILSPSEYKEQLEFANTISRTSRQVPSFSSHPEFQSQIDQLLIMIQSKSSPLEVSNLARTLQRQAIDLAGLEISPRHWPDLAQGEKLFQAQCTACHGITGHGDGAAGRNLNPRPADFHQKELVQESSPYKFYNTIRLGVPGTGMTSFSGLSDEEVWSLAFYLKSLGHEKGTPPTPALLQKISLKEIASLSDTELDEKLRIFEPEASKRAQILAGLRTSSSLGEGPRDSLSVAQKLLTESFESAQAGEFSQAESLALRSYLEGIEPLEPKMKANVPGLTEEIETLMANYRASIAAHSSKEKLSQSFHTVQTKLSQTKELLTEKKMSPGIAFTAAFSIFLREGFEAVLIIIVLLSILKAMNQTEAMKWVHAGWLAAVTLGAITWFASGLLLAMSGLSRELLEGGISLLAVLVLLYVGFWLHRYSEAKKWREFLESKLKTGLHSGSYLVLAVVAFLAVFREAFEVVLFLRAIWMDLDGPGQNIASLGVFSSLAVLLAFSYFAIHESKRLPLGKLFEVCSWTMLVLAFILAGKGVHSLQEAGWISVLDVPIRWRADLIGFFPTAQTIGAQVAVALLFGFLLLKDKKSGAHS
jgi:high-affinity iron transporter